MEDINQGMELASHTVGSTDAEKLPTRKKIRTLYPVENECPYMIQKRIYSPGFPIDRGGELEKQQLGQKKVAA
jgi:hypothetical protein